MGEKISSSLLSAKLFGGQMPHLKMMFNAVLLNFCQLRKILSELLCLHNH